MNQYAHKLLENLLKIYSPSDHESKISNFLKKELESIGLVVNQDENGNIRTEIGQGSPHILLCGHMDTVPGKIRVENKYGRLYGRGAVDAKGPLATMIMAVKHLQQEQFCKITFAAVVDEEGKGKGIKSLVKQNIKPDYVVFGEPSGINNIVVGYKGSLKIKIICKTKTGHSAAPWLYKNAIEEAFAVWDFIKTMRFNIEVDNSRFYSVTKCLTKIEGGSEYNIVPNRCELNVDMRIPPKLTPKTLESLIKEKIYLNFPKDIELKVLTGESVNAYEASTNSLLVNAFSIAIRKINNTKPVLLKKTGSSDINLMAENYGIPMIAYGPGDSKLDHSPDEYIELQDYFKSVKILIEAIRRLKSLNDNKK